MNLCHLFLGLYTRSAGQNVCARLRLIKNSVKEEVIVQAISDNVFRGKENLHYPLCGNNDLSSPPFMAKSSYVSSLVAELNYIPLPWWLN